MHLNINYDPNAGQYAFHASPATFKMMVGALGSGKTATLCVEGLTLSLNHPGNVGLLCRKTLPELKSTTMKRFFEFLPPQLIESYNKTERELYVKTAGKPSLVHFGPLDDISRYKSLELGWFGIDEADATSEEHWQTLSGRLRLKNIPLFGMGATNPTSPQHWIYKNWVANPLPGYEIFRSKTTDNLAHLPPGYVERLRAIYSDDWASRFIDGEFGVLQNGDPAFPDFNPKHHVKTISPTMGRDMIRGWDFGNRRPCCIFAQFDEMGRFKVFRCILGENEDIYSFRDRVIKFSNQVYNPFNFVDYCDPAGKAQRDSGKPSITVLNEKGIYPKFRFTHPDQRATEVRRMQREFLKGEPAFQMDPVNAYLIEAFMGGCSVDANGSIKKDGYYEHGIDALGYIIANTCMVINKEKEVVEISEPKWGYRGVSEWQH